jgi:hypothetical protein
MTGTASSSASHASAPSASTSSPSSVTVPAPNVRSPGGKSVSTSTSPPALVTLTSCTRPRSAPLVRKPTMPGAPWAPFVRESSSAPSTNVSILSPATVIL